MKGEVRRSEQCWMSLIRIFLYLNSQTKLFVSLQIYTTVTDQICGPGIHITNNRTALFICSNDAPNYQKNTEQLHTTMNKLTFYNSLRFKCCFWIIGQCKQHMPLILFLKSKAHTNSTWLFLCMYSIKYLDKDKTEHQHSLVFELVLTLKRQDENKRNKQMGRERGQKERSKFFRPLSICIAFLSIWGKSQSNGVG